MSSIIARSSRIFKYAFIVLYWANKSGLLHFGVKLRLSQLFNILPSLIVFSKSSLYSIMNLCCQSGNSSIMSLCCQSGNSSIIILCYLPYKINDISKFGIVFDANYQTPELCSLPSTRNGQDALIQTLKFCLNHVTLHK